MVSQHFIFDGIKSTDMGLSIVRMDGGLFPTPYTSGKDIVEDKNPKTSASFFYRANMERLSFSVTFSTLDVDFDEEKRYEIARWLFKPDYRVFISDDYIDKLYYVIATNQSDFITNGIDQGYFTVEFKCKYPYPLSPIFYHTFDLLTNTTTENIVIDSRCNVQDYFYPEIEIELDSTATGFSLKNLSDGGRTTTFAGLSNSETLYMDCNRKILVSSTTNPRFDKFTVNNWLRLVYGQNTIQVTGKVKIQFRMQFPLFS